MKWSLVALGVVVVLLSSATIWMGHQDRVDSDKSVIRLNGQALTVPSRYLDADTKGVLSFWRLIPGLDAGEREVLLKIDAGEVSRGIPDYAAKVGEYPDDLRLHVVLLNDDELLRYKNKSRFSEIEMSIGSYSNRIVESDVARGVVRVYRKIEYPNSWEVFKVPKGTALGALPPKLTSLWIGHCINSKSPLTPTGELALCKSFVLSDHIAVHFTLSDANLGNIDEVRGFLLQKISSWRSAQI